MKKDLLGIWLMLLAVLFTVNTEAQITVGGKKAPEAFSVLELLNKGGLRLPQMTTAERNAFAVRGNDKGEGLTIYNKTTGCVEYWNKTRWVSLCEGTSQTVISPEPCVNVGADGSGCNQTFNVTDVDCPNGPFNIAIVAGGEYALLTDVDESNGSFKVMFNPNETVNIHTVLVRVTSTCTSLFKEFLFSQNGVDCTSMSYAVPTISPSSAALTLCGGGSVYLSVPSNTANLDKLIWTRNGIEVARGISYYTATQKGRYNVSMGAVGCNTSASNERTVTESGTTAPTNISILASNNGVICGTNAVTLTASGTTGTVAWFHNGVEEKTGPTASISGDSGVGLWFAAVKNGSCYSSQSNTVTITKSEATGQISVPAADVRVNNVPLNTFTAFCAGGSLNLSVANQVSGVTYTWYNGNTAITENPYIVPNGLTKISLRMVATDNSGAKCPAENSVMEKDVTNGSTPAMPNIAGNATLCDGSTTLTLVPVASGTYTYTWYKDGVKMADTTDSITITETGSIYSGSVTNATGCTSPLAQKAISPVLSSLPVVTFITKPATAIYGAKVTLQTAIEFGPASSYTWTADKGAVITGTGANVSVQFPSSGTDGNVFTIKVTAQNSCGASETAELPITVSNACPTPTVKEQSSLTQNTYAGKAVTMRVSVTNAVSETYQWYTNSTASTVGGSAIVGAVSNSCTYTPAAIGSYYIYCLVTNGCTGRLSGTSPVFTVVAVKDPATLPTGAGTLTGKTCFDIAESNDGGTCGTLTGRTTTKSDFNLTATNTQTYTFTPTGTISKVRFVFVESFRDHIVTSLTPTVDNSTATNVTGVQKATLVYKTTLSSSAGVTGDAKGTTTANPLFVDIYVIYNDNASGTGTDRAVKITANIKDCACCGAYLNSKVWKDFMCYNLGADTTVDPMNPLNASQLKGDQYYWGNSSASGTATAPGGWDTTDKNNPCPQGYRLPTFSEWGQVVNRANNTFNWVGNRNNASGGLQVGQNLFLPGTHPSSDTINITMMSIDYIYVMQVQSYAGTDPYIRNYDYDFGQRYMSHAIRCIAK